MDYSASRSFARTTAILLSATIAFGISGCGREADPADVKALSEQFRKPDGPLGLPVDKKQSDCRATVLLEADLSDKARDQLLKTGVPSAATKHDREVLRDIADDLADCL